MDNSAGHGHGARGMAPTHRGAPSSHRSEQELVSRVKALAIHRVVRPGIGKRGAAIALRTNFFPLKYPKNVVVYDYAVLVAPEILPDARHVRRRLFDLLEASQEMAPFLHDVAHDRSQRLVSNRLLPADLSVNIPFYEAGERGPRPDSKVYLVKFIKTKELNSADLHRFLQGDDASYNPLPMISAFNLITSSHAARVGVSFGDNRYFFPPSAFSKAETLRLGLGLELWKGFFASVKPVYKNLMVNVNVCMGTFYVPFERLSDAMLQYEKYSHGATNPVTLYSRVKVTTRYHGHRRKYKIKSFGNQSARKTMVRSDEQGGMVSVEQYFYRKYNIRLQHADDLPVVNIGNKTRDTFVPAELCEIEAGQPYTGVLSERENAELARFTRNALHVNGQAIASQSLGMLGLRQRAPPMAGFGVEVSTEMAVVSARVLPAPKVKYQASEPDIVNGSWNAAGMRFARPAALSRVAILVLPDGGRDDFKDAADPALREAVERFLQTCRKRGMQVDTKMPALLFVPLPRRSSRDPFRTAAFDAVEQALKTLPGRPNVVLVFMSGSDPLVYPGLKRLCDMKLGIQSVCMRMARVRVEKGQARLLANVALKVNTKLGGLNHQLDAGSLLWLKNAMLVGMDVTHPGFGSMNGMPSIAAVVASCDMDFMHYPASLRLQEHRKHMITDVKKMMVERLNEYSKHQKSLPERVIVFRNAISDGQVNQVLVSELPEIKAAFRSFQDYKPKLTIVLCAKRRSARFYPASPARAEKTCAKAGTVVDQGVVSTCDFDFYLQAHAGVQGTEHATHYTVVFDENAYVADDIQQGANDVSYLWACATSAVSVVPPAYWADRACERGRLYLHEMLPAPDDGRELKLSEEQIKTMAREMWGNGVHGDLKGTMFYL